MDDDAETRLLEAARKGDEGAFGRLVELHWGALFGTVRRVVRDYHLAQDLVQEAFLRAHENLWRLEERVNFGHWVRRIGRNIAVDRVRARRVREEVADPEALASAGAVREAGAGGAVGADEGRVERVWEAVAELPARDRALLLLRYGRGFSCPEIARELGVSLSVAKVGLHRARMRLYGVLAADRGEERGGRREA